MDRGDGIVRGTDTSVHGARSSVYAPVSFQRYLASVKDSDNLDPNEALTAALSSRVRRKAGAFFTSPQVADALVAPFAGDLKGDAMVVDPTCGAGDLLLAAARYLKAAKDPQRRLEDWQRRI